MDGESVDKPTDTEPASEEGSGGESDESSPPPSDENSGAREEMDFTKQFEILGKLDEDWRDHMANAGGQNYSAEDAEKRQHFFDSLVSETSLQEHLMQQVVLDDLSPPVREALQQLIGNLDDRGYLAQSPSDVALQAGLPYETVMEALKLLLSFDPPGIGSQTLAECLLAQLKSKGRGDTLAARMLRDHFDLLSRRRIPELSRKLSVAPDDVQSAIEEIGKLDPAPGRRFAEDNNRVVVPDVVVEKEGDEWKVHLNSDYIPRLRLSSTYRELIAKGTLSKEERDYLRERMRSGKFLIDSIEQRQRTIERITREIIKAQLPFFEQGVSQLRPLTMTQIADIVGVHETTVSRAIANKYMQTPHGVFDFKYFFTTGYQAESGASVSNTIA
jgi:RNA polymerase sigma-54 factor